MSRPEYIALRASEREKAQIVAAAEGRGLSVGAYLRDCHAQAMRAALPARVGNGIRPALPTALELAGRIEVPVAAANRLLARGAVGILDGRLLVDGADEGSWP